MVNRHPYRYIFEVGDASVLYRGINVQKTHPDLEEKSSHKYCVMTRSDI